jgi:hypothetical protein
MLKKQIAIIVLVLWLTLITFLMLLAERFDFIEFFVLGLIGLLVIVELTEPTYVQPRYFHFLKYVIGVGIVIFGVIVVQVAMDTLGLVIVF